MSTEVDVSTMHCWKCGDPHVDTRRVQVGRVRTTREQIAQGAEDRNMYRVFVVCRACGYKFQPAQDRYLKHIVHNRGRNDQIAEIASRFAAGGQSVMVYVGLVVHGTTLEMLIRARLAERGVNPAVCAFIHGQLDESTNEDAKARFIRRELLVVVCTSVWGEGTNIPTLQWVIYAKAGLPGLELEQVIGRALRRPSGKYHVGFVDFTDRGLTTFETRGRGRMKFLARKGFPVTTLSAQPPTRIGRTRFVGKKSI